MLPRIIDPLNRIDDPWYKVLFTTIRDIVCILAIMTAIVGLILMIALLLPDCPKCKHLVYPMDTYCSNCGHQLRTTE